jgi:uncharacterized protein with HEPN domain
MPPREWRLRIEDMLEAIAKAQRFTEGMTPETFAVDEKSVDAVAYCFVVLGEAARNIPAAVVDAHPEIPWSEMRGLRSIAAHEYFGVTRETLLKTVFDDLPPLVPALRALLEEEL